MLFFICSEILPSFCIGIVKLSSALANKLEQTKVDLNLSLLLDSLRLLRLLSSCQMELDHAR